MVGTRTNDTSKSVQLDPAGLMHHSLIVGQSGSGKSFFIARLIEEVVLNTTARVVIVDSNGDFRSIASPNDGIFVSEVARFLTVRDRRAPSFDVANTFSAAWKQRRFLHLHPNVSDLPGDSASVLNRRLVIHWESLEEHDREFLLRLGRPLSAQVQTGLEVAILHAQFLSEKYGNEFTIDLRGLLYAADQFAARNVSLLHYPQVKNLTPEDWAGVRSTIAELLQRHTVWSSTGTELSTRRPRGLADFVDGPFISAPSSSELYWDVLTLALDAARESDSLLVVDVLLGRLWRNVKAAWRRVTSPAAAGKDLRVPTFLVIDEAQNFAPTESPNLLRRRVTERLLQIASEGRKYGIYLILATQRPTKLHPALVPECENSCVLRVQSALDIRFAIDTLGIEEKLARNCPSFRKGQGLVSGRWLDSDVGVDTQCVPARTVVGGGGLPDTWQVRVEPSAPFALDDPLVTVREVVTAELKAAGAPITLVELAEVVRAECPEVQERGWLGRQTFKALLADTGIKELAFSAVAPGYAYLGGTHKPPRMETMTEVPRAPNALMELHRQKDTPLLTSDVYRTILTTLSKVVQETPFNLTDASRAVRDTMLAHEVRAGRSSIGYVIKGVGYGGHRFDPDLPQEPQTLAAAFVRSVLHDLRITVPLEGNALIEVLIHCSGGLLDRDAVERIVAQSARPAGADSALSAEAIDEGGTLRREDSPTTDMGV